MVRSGNSKLPPINSTPFTIFHNIHLLSFMASKPGVDLWAEIIAEEDAERNPERQKQAHYQPVYQRRRRPPQNTLQNVSLQQLGSRKESRVSFVGPAIKRISWNRSLSTRGRVSIAVAACVENQPQTKQPRKKGRPPLAKGKAVQPPDFEKERKYFEEVDAFELLEESPSPKNTWLAGFQTGTSEIPHLSLRLQKWLVSKKLDFSCEPSTTLSNILESPGLLPSETVGGENFSTLKLESPENSALQGYSGLHSVQRRINSFIRRKDVRQVDSHAQKSNSMMASLVADNCIDIEDAVRKLSLASSYTSVSQDYIDPFAALLAVCGQSVPLTLLDVLSKYCDPESIIKVGEGTYGEVFKVGNTVCKIVPVDGDLRVNGEIQKRSEELLEEVVLSQTLNQLRAHDSDVKNACTAFIETLNSSVCQGPYDSILIRAWEDWDEEHGSENDHPKEFSEKQCYVVLVLQHGGDDLESFVLMNFAEAQSLLCQVTAALAVAEAAYEFEHRDLHWGNILLYRNETPTVQFTLEGKKLRFSSSGLFISIIDFTLSRINTGEDILFLDLSADPDLFKGPKGDRQAETYRKMREVTGDLWNGSFPRTNVLWLIYLVDILLLKKSFERSSKNERDLRSLKKRLEKCNSAKEAIEDPFFRDMLAEHK